MTRGQRKRLQAELDKHGMTWETGKCYCGHNCHGSTEEADAHFTEVAFALGYEEGRGK